MSLFSFYFARITDPIMERTTQKLGVCNHENFYRDFIHGMSVR